MASRGIKLRSWAVWAEDYVDDYGNDTGFRAAVAEELSRLEHMGERLGVGFVATPVRQQVESGPGRPLEWQTTAWMFQTETVPASDVWHPAPIALGEDSAGTGEIVIEPQGAEA